MPGIYAQLPKIARIQLPGTQTPYAIIDIALREMTAPNFSSEVSYGVNDMVIYENQLYVCNTPQGSGEEAPDGNKWSIVTVSSEFKSLKEQIAGGIHYRGYTTYSLYEDSTQNPIDIGGQGYLAETGDMVIENPPAYSTTKEWPQTDPLLAYHRGEFCTYNGFIYQFTEDVTKAANTGWDAVSGYTVVKAAQPEFIFDGTRWNELGSTDPSQFGDFAYADTGRVTVDVPTGYGSVTVHGPVTNTKKALTTTTITGTNGTQNVTKVTGGDTKDIAKVGTAVRYGTADVGAAVVYGTANKATNGTRVGNADVDTAVTYGTADVGAAVRYGTANVGTAVTYGTADVGESMKAFYKWTDNSVKTFNTDAIKSAALTGTKTFTTNGIKSATLTGTGVVSGTAEFAKTGITANVGHGDQDTQNDMLIFSTAATGTATVDTESGDSGTVGITTSPASTASFDLDYQMIPSAVASAKTLTPAVAAPNDQTLTPATASTKTLTPAKPLSSSSTLVYEAVTSTSTLTPAVAAPNNQTLTPAASNGTLTGSYTLTNYDVAKVADAATTVATGALRNAVDADTNKVVVETSQTTETDTVTVGTTTRQYTVYPNMNK